MDRHDEGDEIMTDPRDKWGEACDLARDHVLATYDRDPSAAGQLAIEMATELRAVAHHLAGIACPRCQGTGERTYADTSTWRGGIGGQMITVGICDQCWGTGRTDRSGPNLRKLSGLVYVAPIDQLAVWLLQREWVVHRVHSDAPTLRAVGPHGVEIDATYTTEHGPVEVEVRLDRRVLGKVSSRRPVAQTIPHALAEVASKLSARSERARGVLRMELDHTWR